MHGRKNLIMALYGPHDYHMGESLPTFVRSFDGDIEEQTANAQVMAASKDVHALTSICIMPWGYCCCPPQMGDMEGKPDEAHCGECKDARTAIAKAKGVGNG